MSVHAAVCTVLLLVLAWTSLAQQARSGPPGVFQNPARSKQLQLRPCTRLLPDVSSPVSTAAEAVVKPQGCGAHQLALASSKGGLLLPADLPDSVAAIWCRKSFRQVLI